MNVHFYKKIIEQFPVGYAYHKIICDPKGTPVDYEFIEANYKFQALTGLIDLNIIGKRVTEVLPGINKGEFDWIKFYGDLALHGGTKEFEQFAEPLQRWYRVYAYAPEKYYFITYFTDISREREQFIELDNFFRVNLDLLCIADFEGNFLKVNKEWENILGYFSEELEKRKIFEFVHPDDLEATLDEILKLSKQEQVTNFINRLKCKDGSYRYIEWRSQPSGKLIYAAARDITDKIQEHKSLRRMVEISEEFLQLHENGLDYQKITDEFLELCGAKFAAFNLYDEDGMHYTTVSVSGDHEIIKKAAHMSGIKLQGKRWPHNPLRAEKIKDKTITRLSSLEELTGNIIPRTIYAQMMNRFNVGETVIAKITSNNLIIGNFTLLMDKGKSFNQDSLAEVYTRQLGLVITRHRIENLLRLERERLANIIEGTNAGTWEWDVQTGETLFNERWAEIFGYTLAEISPVSIETWLHFVHPEDLKNSLSQLSQVFARKKNYYDIECRMKHKDGSWVWVNSRGKVVSWTTDGKPNIMSGTHTDITQRKQAEEKYRQIAENITDVVWIADLQLRTTYISPSIERLLGDSVSEYLSRPMEEKFPPDSLHKIISIMQEELEKDKEPGSDKNRTRLIEVEHYRIDGTTIWIAMHVSFIRDEHGDPIGFQGVTRDITENKLMAEKLQESQHMLKMVLDTVPARIFWKDVDLNYLGCNRLFAQDVGLADPEEIVGLNDYQIFWRDQADLYRKDDLDVIKTGNPKINYEESQTTLGGDTLWGRTSKIPLRNETDKIIGVLGTYEDITARKKMEELVCLEKERLKTTLLSIGDGVISTDNRGNVALLNTIAEKLTGWTQEEAFGKPLEEVFHIINEFTRVRCENPAYKAMETRSIVELANHTMLISKNGFEWPIEDSAAPIMDREKNIHGVVLVFRDVTEKKKKQAEIEYLSFHDQLTGLYNRRFFEEELERLDTTINLPLTIAMLDINGLKLANDAFGHAVGDMVLKKVAKLIKKVFRSDDVIARIGGDEFVIILKKTNSKRAKRIMERLTKAISSEKVKSLILSISCGWETKYNNDDNIATILKKAEDQMYRRKLSESASIHHKTISVIIKTLYEKNQREEKHSKRVGQLCAAIGTALGLKDEDIGELRTVGLMHDIGKIAIDDRILNRPEALVESEWLEIKRHPEIGYKILSSVNEFAPLAEYVLAHHERWDGNGYPRGLKGEKIPLEARIIAVADAYDAMTSDRPYRLGLSQDAALAEIKRNAGTQFDPVIVKVFLEKVYNSYQKSHY